MYSIIKLVGTIDRRTRNVFNCGNLYVVIFQAIPVSTPYEKLYNCVRACVIQTEMLFPKTKKCLLE